MNKMNSIHLDNEARATQKKNWNEIKSIRYLSLFLFFYKSSRENKKRAHRAFASFYTIQKKNIYLSLYTLKIVKWFCYINKLLLISDSIWIGKYVTLQYVHI